MKFFIKIGQVSKIIDVPEHTLRYWEKEFNLELEKTFGGQRLYSSSDIDNLFQIKRLLREEMYSVAGAKQRFYQPR